MSKRSILYGCALVCIAILTATVSAGAQDNPRITIELKHAVLFDHDVQANVVFDPGTTFTHELGYFDLLIKYDPNAATLTSVDIGGDLAICGWESFTWVEGTAADCGGSPCPSGVIRITARADLNDGPPAPSCLVTSLSELAVLTFHTSADENTWECVYTPIELVWYDCGDNVAMTSFTSDSLFASDRVWDQDGYTELTQDLPFPTAYGAPASCIPGGNAGKVTTRAIDYQRGGIDFVCVDSIDARGDINLNGIAYEIADLISLQNYFIYGPGVFINLPMQTAASDVNNDGIPLALSDLIYEHRVIIGDALPFPRPVLSPTASAIVTQDGTTSTVRIEYSGRITAAWFVFGGVVDPLCAFPTHVAAFDETHPTPYTRVLVYMAQFGDLVDFPSMDTSRVIIGYTGSGTLLHAEVASDGLENIPVSLEYNNVPSCCVLRGNVNGIDQINIADLTTLVGFLFQGNFPPPPCPEEADVDGLGGSSPITVSDITYLVSYLFQNGAPPPPCQ